MLYEPVGYILEYEMSALLFLLVIMLRYFSAKRFPNQKNRLYIIALWGTVLYIVLDVVSSEIIDHIFTVPIPLVYILNTMFYLMAVLMPVIMMVYTLVLAGPLKGERIKKLLPLFFPGLFIAILLLVNPANGYFFYVDPASGYVHGSLFILVYVVCHFYLIVTFIVAFRNRGVMLKDESTNIFRFLVLVFVSTIVQFVYPVFLITGVATALAVILMYFTIQNPETMIDSTTGAFTYEAMLSFMKDRMIEQDRVQLVAVKIHNMSRVNELLGIENGGILLEQVSDFLKKASRDSWVFRMRGSCFVAITRRNDDYQRLCKKVEERIAKPWIVSSTNVLLQATVCRVATEDISDRPITPEETINYLETAFAQNVKLSTRINYVTAGSELLTQVERNRVLENVLREAIETGEGLVLYYQPVWSLKQKRFVNAEVLLRFFHPELGSISPSEFVSIAENRGLITELDELVVRKVCEFIHENPCLKEMGLEALEVNLSALELMYQRLPELLKSIMRQYQVDPSFIYFEITETAATESFELVNECMQDLVQMGCKFALDDFGTGYANISKVIQLPFSMIKIDKTLLYGPTSVLEDIARMFERMNCATVVEGVELIEQAELVKSIDVDLIQGFFYATPMSQEDFLSFLRAHNYEVKEEETNLKEK